MVELPVSDEFQIRKCWGFNQLANLLNISGFFLTVGFYHVGVVKALMDNNLMPRVIGGSSAGSILCAIVGTRTDEECQEEMFKGLPTHAPGHSGSLSFNFFRPKEVKGSLASQSLATQDPKATWQVIMPIGLRRITSIIYDILTGHRRPQDAFMNDTNHFREVCKANIGNFT